MTLFNLHFVSGAGLQALDYARAIQSLGHTVSVSLGSSDAGTQAAGLSVKKGYDGSRITRSLTAVVASPDVAYSNPECDAARNSGVPVWSLAELVVHVCIDKQRMVITGSQCVSFVTRLVIHVLNACKRPFDYVTVTPPAGQASSVRFTATSPLVVIEGTDMPDYGATTLPTFLSYQHHIGVITGIQWKAGNPISEDDYLRHFDSFEGAIPKGGVLVYFESDPVLNALSNLEKPDVLFVPYKAHPVHTDGGQEYISAPGKERITLKVQGKPNLSHFSNRFTGGTYVG